MQLVQRMALAGFAMVAMALPTAAMAQEQVADSGDTGWMLVASALLLLMVLPGLSLYYAGRVATARAAMIGAAGVFAVTASVSLLWIAITYSLTFSPTGGAYIGDTFNWMLNNLSMVRGATTVPESVFALFQMGFACLAAALVIGSVFDRARFGWMLGFATLWSLLVYMPIAHGMWGSGWLGAMGALDFAGGLTVHATAGVSALVAAIVVGKRRHATMDAPIGTQSNPPSPALSLAGIGMLWVGFLVLNSASELGATDDAAMAFINGHMAACAAALIWALLERVITGKVSALGVAMGGLAGIVSVTASAGYIGPGGAMIIGAIGGLASFFAARMLRDRFNIDDTADIFAVSGVCGIVGTLLVAPFLSQSLGGLGFDGKMTLVSQLIAQAISVGVVILWATIGTLICAYSVAVIGKMQADDIED